MEGDPDARMMQLVSEMLKLAPAVSPGLLRSAAKQLQGALETPADSGSEGEESPAPVLRLPFTEQLEPDAVSDATSDATSDPASSRAGSIVSSDDDVPSGAAIFAPRRGAGVSQR